MAIADVKPTRSELIKLKKRIKLSKNGHKLLKMKRDGLIMEFFEILNKARDVRGQLSEDYRRAADKIALAEAVDGKNAVVSASFTRKVKPVVQLSSKNIMGVVVPRVEGTEVKRKLLERGYGLIGTSTRIDEAAESFEALVEDIVYAAEVETTLRKLLDEIEKTKRRVNALEFVVIPDLEEAADFIEMRLDEQERENIFRLKRVKAKKEAERREEADAAEQTEDAEAAAEGDGGEPADGGASPGTTA